MNNKIKEAFDQVHASEDLKQHTLDSIYQKTNGFQPRKTFYMRKYAVAMACCLLLFLGSGGCYSYFTPVSAISIDINPSVELNINRFDRVINMKGYNKDGEKLADTINVRFLKYSDAIEKILSSEELKPYLIPEHLISVTVAGEDEEQNEKMLENVEATTAACGEKIHCDSSSSEEVQSAHDLGMSVGKYKAYEKLKALDPNVTPEEIHHLTMRQIYDRIAELSGEPVTSDATCTEGNQNGSHEQNSQNDQHGEHQNQNAETHTPESTGHQKRKGKNQ